MRIENGINDIMPVRPSQNGNLNSRTDSAEKEFITIDSISNNQQNKPVEVGKKQNEEEVFEEGQVIEAIEKANKTFKSYDRKLEFSIHDKTKEIMVKVINTEDNSIIREIPSQKVLDMVAHMWEVAGILVDEKR